MSDWLASWYERVKGFKQYCAEQQHRYLMALTDPIATQALVLKDILKITGNTQFSSDHGLNKVHDLQALQTHVPIRSYDQFLPWINAEVNARGGVLSNSPLVRWLKTSGSTGQSKRIPYTEHWMAKYRTPALGVLWAYYLAAESTLLSHPFSTLDTQTIREPVQDFLNGLPYQSITNRDPLIDENDWLPPWYHSPWFSPTIPEGYQQRMYCRLRYFIGKDLNVITAINPSTLIAIRYHLLKNLSKLVTDIADGTLFGQKLFEPMPKLAAKLSQFTTNSSLKTIWPNLMLISCWTAASAELYHQQLNAIFPSVKILPFMTCGTEGVVTLPTNTENIPGTLAITQGVYEFLPATVKLATVLEQSTPIKTLSFYELEVGKEYHVIMTQANGLYRLAVGDIYQVVDYEGLVPRLVFRRRDGVYFSFTGEKITETQMLAAVQAAMKDCHHKLGLFMCFPIWADIPYYAILLEQQNEMPVGLTDYYAEIIDRHLAEVNEEYAAKRKSHRLDNIKVSFIKAGTIDAYLEQRKSMNNSTQFKYKPLQTDVLLYEELLQQVHQ